MPLRTRSRWLRSLSAVLSGVQKQAATLGVLATIAGGLEEQRPSYPSRPMEAGKVPIKVVQLTVALFQWIWPSRRRSCASLSKSRECLTREQAQKIIRKAEKRSARSTTPRRPEPYSQLKKHRAPSTPLQSIGKMGGVSGIHNNGEDQPSLRARWSGWLAACQPITGSGATGCSRACQACA